MATLEAIGLFLTSLILCVTLSLYLGHLLFGSISSKSRKNTNEKYCEQLSVSPALPASPPGFISSQDDEEEMAFEQGMILDENSWESEETASGEGEADSEGQNAGIYRGPVSILSESVKTKQNSFTTSFEATLQQLRHLILEEKKFPSEDVINAIDQIEKILWTELPLTFPNDRVAQLTTMSICLSHMVHLDVS